MFFKYMCVRLPYSKLELVTDFSVILMLRTYRAVIGAYFNHVHGYISKNKVSLQHAIRTYREVNV